MKAKCNAWIKRNYIWLVSAGITAVFMLTVMIAGEVAPFGDGSLTMVDSIHQYIAFFSDYQEKLREGDSLLFTWNVGMGTNFLSLLLYYLASPLNLVLLFTPRTAMTSVMSILIALKLVISSASMGYFLSRRGERIDRSPFIVPVSVAFSLSGYMIGYAWNIMWLDSIMIFPIIMLGYERLMKKGDFRLYTASLFFTIFVNYYIAFMECIFLFLWFFTQEFDSFKDLVRKLLRFAGYSVLAAAMAAMSLITALISIRSTSAGSAFFPESSLYVNFLDLLGGHLIFSEPIKMQTFDGNANLYCGVFSVFFFMIFLFTREIKISARLKRSAVLIIMVLSMNDALLNFIWHGFHDQHGIPNRFAFLYIFAILLSGYEASRFFRKERPWRVIVPALISAAFFAAVTIYSGAPGRIPELFGELRGAISTGDSEPEMALWKLLNAAGGPVSIMLTVIYAVYILMIRKKRRVMTILLSALITLEMILSGAFSYVKMGFADGGYYMEYAREMERIAPAEKNDDEFFREEVLGNRITDENTFDNLRSIGTFCSTVREDTVVTLGRLGFYEGVNEYLYKGTDPATDMLFGVRNIYVHDEGYIDEIGMYNFKESDGGTSVYEFMYPLSIGYAVSEDAADIAYEGVRDDENVNTLITGMTGAGSIFSSLRGSVTAESEDCSLQVDPDDRSLYTYSDIEDTADITFNISFPADGVYFAEIRGNNLSNLDYYKNGKLVTSGRYVNQLFCLGDIKKDDEIRLVTRYQGEEGAGGTIRLSLSEFKKYNFLAAYEELSTSQMKVSRVTSSVIEGDVYIDEGEMLFLSVPFDEGWRAEVDGERAEIVETAGAFIGIRMPKGQHSVRLRYIPEGLREGALISAAAFIAYIFLFILYTVNSRDKGRKRIFRNGKSN